MKFKLSILLVICCLPALTALSQQRVFPGGGQQNADAQQKVFTGVELEPTVAYLRYHSGSARMVRLLFHGGKSYNAGTAYLQFNGLTDSIAVEANKEGITYFELPLPGVPVQKETQVAVKYVTNGNVYTARAIVAPTREWSVYLMPHSHVDVGYTNVQAKVLDIHMNNIDEAIKIAQRTENYPAEARFKWNTEAIWVVDNYLAKADAAKQKAFWEAVKKGWINLDGSYGNVNTSATSSIQLLHQFQNSLQLAKEHGIEVHTMFQGDVPGASWGLSAQSDITGIKYFLSAPNSSDRIGDADRLRDKPFYWLSPSGGQKLLFWQSSPYSIGYELKGDKIPNFFNVADPKPFYTGKPSENFLNPYLFEYLSTLEQKSFPYNMTLLTWAMSDNAPIDPELPDAVKAWNERYTSPRLVITSTKQFFHDFETAYQEKIPVVAGDYTEYWTDGISSGARETALNRNASDALQQAGAIWALRGKKDYPAADFNKAWVNMVMFNEHTWGAYNSVSNPKDPKVISQWQYKQNFALQGQAQTTTLLQTSVEGEAANTNSVDVYNTLSYSRKNVVTVPAALSKAGDAVIDSKGQQLPSQRLSNGDLAFMTTELAPFSKQRFTIREGKEKAPAKSAATVKGDAVANEFYSVKLSATTGNIIDFKKAATKNNLADSGGLNQYDYLPGDSAAKVVTSGTATLAIVDKGPLVASILAISNAPGANSLSREVRVVAGIDRVEVINTIDKKAIGTKESLHFVFPFDVPGAQVRYNIPWGSVKAEADQFKYSNKNWYTMQRWVDVSNKDMGITWTSPDAPLFEIGQYPTAGLLGGLHDSPLWRSYTEQQPLISSWVMNNLWHTNFRYAQEGKVTFHYYLHVHNAYDAAQVNEVALEDHQPLIVVPASGSAGESLFFNINTGNAYVENINPASDGNGVLMQLVNASEMPTTITLSPKEKGTVLQVGESNLLEEHKSDLGNTFSIPGKGVLMIRVAKK